MDLTKVNGCYSKELRECTYMIKLMLKESSISTNEMRRIVLGIIERASINADAKKRFIENLHKCKSKEEIDKRCHEAVIHGMFYRPKNKKVLSNT